jgi:hypothetical protein
MKRISRFDHFFLILPALLISSCGPQRNTKVSSVFSISAIMSTTRDLTTAERAVAARICYAYQSKYTNFRTQTYYGATFNFNIDSRDCENVRANYSISAILTTSPTYLANYPKPLIYSTNSTKSFNSAVQTAQAGFLSQLCNKIQNNLPISNTATDSGNTIQVSFTATDIDSYTLQYFTPVNNVMKIQFAETFKVRTQFSIGTNQILGMDEIYSKQKVCEKYPDRFSDFNQLYVNFGL